MAVPQFVDISAYQGTVNWSAYTTWAKSFDGVAHVSLKSSEGAGIIDPKYKSYRAGAEAAGIGRIIHYHYARPDLGNSAVAEADYQHSTTGAIGANDVVMLDYEQSSPQTTAAWALAWLERQEANYGRLPIIYASVSFVQAHLQDSRLARYPLVLADWQFTPTERPPAPAPWSSYKYLQFTDKATIPGISGAVDADIYLGSESTVTTKHWFEYDWGVHFGTGDVAFGGAHDATILAPPNYPVTFVLPGTIVDLSEPSWGKQVGIKLDTPYNGVEYFAFLHLSALHPGLSLNLHVNAGDIAGYVGGANTESQYAGTSNPTGQNFLNTTVMSSQVQVGFALMRGPTYGNGAGWSTFPPVDQSLNPEQIILDARKAIVVDHFPQEAIDCWNSIFNQFKALAKAFNIALPANFAFAPPTGTGIYKAWADAWLKGKQFGPPITFEYDSVRKDGSKIIVQEFAHARCEWDGSPHWFSINGAIVV